MTQKKPFTDPLRKAIVESGLPHLTLEQKTGVSRGSIRRFVEGRTSLRLDIADRLAVFLGVEARQKKTGTR